VQAAIDCQNAAAREVETSFRLGQLNRVRSKKQACCAFLLDMNKCMLMSLYGCTYVCTTHISKDYLFVYVQTGQHTEAFQILHDRASVKDAARMLKVRV
jgi:hypothetical protein